MWPDGQIGFSLFGHLHQWKFVQNHTNCSKVGSFTTLPNTKLTLKISPNIFQFVANAAKFRQIWSHWLGPVAQQWCLYIHALRDAIVIVFLACQTCNSLLRKTHQCECGNPSESYTTWLSGIQSIHRCAPFFNLFRSWPELNRRSVPSPNLSPSFVSKQSNVRHTYLGTYLSTNAIIRVIMLHRRSNSGANSSLLYIRSPT